MVSFIIICPAVLCESDQKEKKQPACFIIYFRAFPKIHVKEIADFTFKTRKILKLQEKQNVSLPVLPHSCSI